jgi:hypothetical protein
MDSNKTIVLALKLAIVLLTVFLNGFLVFIFSILLKKSKKGDFSNLIFLSIAISDFMIGLLSMSSQTVLDIMGKWPFDDKISCLISAYLQYAIPDTTILELLVLSVHRFLLIKLPHIETEQINASNLIKLFTPWLLTVIFWMGSLSYHSWNKRFSSITCVIEPSFEFKLFKVISLGILPLFLIILFNCWSGCALGKRQRLHNHTRINHIIKLSTRISQSLSDLKTKPYFPINRPDKADVLVVENDATNKTTRISKTNKDYLRKSNYFKINKHQKAVVCILVLTMSIFLTQIIYLISWPLMDPLASQLIKTSYNIGVWLSYLTSLTNPVLVFIFHEKVRKFLKILFCFKRN